MIAVTCQLNLHAGFFAIVRTIFLAFGDYTIARSMGAFMGI